MICGSLRSVPLPIEWADAESLTRFPSPLHAQLMLDSMNMRVTEAWRKVVAIVRLITLKREAAMPVSVTAGHSGTMSILADFDFRSSSDSVVRVSSASPESRFSWNYPETL